MDKHWVEEIFERCGAILKGHFALTSGRHSNRYLDKTLVYPYLVEIDDLAEGIAEEIRPNHFEIEVVVGPAYGGIILSYLVADYIVERLPLSLFTEKDEKGKQILKRGYKNLVTGKRVLVVDDILTTGGSIKQVINEVENAGGLVVAVAVICNRGKITSKDIGGYPLFSLWDIEIESWESQECPLCKANIPLIDPKAR